MCIRYTIAVSCKFPENILSFKLSLLPWLHNEHNDIIHALKMLNLEPIHLDIISTLS